MSAHLRPGPTRRPWTAALAVVAVGLLATTATALPGETGRIAFSRDGDVWAADADGTDHVQLTSDPEDERWPRWSPEGNRIAVVRDGDLMLLRATGTRLRRLTTHGDVVAAPSWSPDGRYIAYVRGGGIAIVDATQAESNGTPLELGTVTSVAWNPLDPNQIAYTDGGAVFTVRPDGSEPETVIVAPDPEGRTRDELAWDPGSGQVVFTSAGGDGTRIEGAGILVGDGAAGDDRSPAWSPDGQRMLFTRGGTLHVYQRVPFPGTGHVRALGPIGDTPDAQPSLVSPAAAYESDTGTQLFFSVRSVGSSPVTVTYQTVSGAGSATAGSDYAAAVGEVATPDPFGNAVGVPVPLLGDFDTEEDETFYVDFTFPSDPAAPLRVRGTILNDDGGRNGIITYTADQAVSALDPVRGLSERIVAGAGSAVYSPSGQRLAYLRMDAGQIQLVVANASGAAQVTFPLSGPIDHEIVWSPDGARLAWTMGATLWVADPTNPSSAISVANDAVTPSWSSDPGTSPRRLAFTRVSTGTVCTVKEDGSEESCLTAGYQPRWSPDNLTIAFLRGAAVFLMNPNGTGERLAVSIVGSPDARLLRWSPRGGSFAFMTDIALYVGQEGSPPLGVAGLPASLGSFDWSPDGNQLVVQGASPTGEPQLWIVGPDDAGTPFAAVRQVTAGAGGAVEPRWSSVAVRPTANLASRGGIERFHQARAEVELDAPSADTVTLTWETVDTGSATAGVDFTSGTGTVVLQPGETRGAIVVALLDDALAEGPESFDVRFTGATGARLGEVSRVPVFITDDDNPPIARADVAATAIDTPVDVAVLANDSDPDGDPVSLIAVDAPAHGSVTFAGGVVTYTPQSGFAGVDHFLYAISDGNGHTAQGLVSVFVGVPPPAPPVLTVTPAFLDFGTVPLNKTTDLVVTVTNGTADPVALAETFVVEQADPRPFDVSDFEGCRSPAARVLDPGESCTQKVRFWSIPGADAASPATARLLDGVTFETLATVVLFAATGPPDTGPNLPPVAVDDLAGVAPGFTHTLDAIRNDSDPDHDILRITAVSDPAHGIAEVIPCNAFPQNPNADCVRYVPDAGYTGTDAFMYAVSDGRGGDATATFHLAVGTVVPNVEAVTPAVGPTTGGQAIRITGTGFVYRSQVAFVCPTGLVPLEVGQLGDTEILATTTPAPPGVCAVRVRTLLGQQGELADAYRYADGALLSIVTTTLPGATQGVAYGAPIEATGGSGAGYEWSVSAGAPPPGLDLGTTGTPSTLLAGQAGAAGTFDFTVRVMDSSGGVATRSFTLTVDPGIEITTTTLPDPIEGVPYSQAITSSGGSGSGQTWAVVAGSLPPGLALVATGGGPTTDVTGTPTVAAPYAFTVRVTDSSGAFDEQTYAGTVRPRLEIEATILAVGVLQTPYAQQVTATGGTGSGHRWTVSGGVLPPGLTLSNTGTVAVTIGGTPTAAGTFLFTLRVEDSSGIHATRSFAIVVHEALAIPATTLAAAVEGVAYTAMITATGGTLAGYTWQIVLGALPPGLALGPAGTPSATLSGTPTADGTFNFTVRVEDSAGHQASQAFTLVVHPRVVVIDVAETVHVTDGGGVDPAVMIDGPEPIRVSDDVTIKTSPRADDGTASTAEDTAVLVTVSATDADGDPFTITIVSGPAHGTVFPPPGVVMPSGTLVTYTPAPNYFGADSFTFKATDAQGDSNVARVATAVAAVPDAPVAASDGPYVLNLPGTLTVQPPGVLLNDVELDFEPLTARVVTAPDHGTLTLTPDGGFTYDPAAGFFGQDTFTYVASDGLLDSNPAVVAIVVQRAPGHEAVAGLVPAGGTLTTDSEGDGATLQDAIETTVLTPQGGHISIDEEPAPPPPPTAFTFLPLLVQVTAPPGSASQPLVLTFLVDGHAVSSAGATLETLRVFRNGFEVPPCLPGSSAAPDPCVPLRQMAGDDVRLAVRTSRASAWTFGVPRSTPGLATGALAPLSGGSVSFAATWFDGQLVGVLSYQKRSERFLALRVSAFAVEDDGHTAWFAGLGLDGRAFLAFAADGGDEDDRFRLWIGGVDQTGDGRLASGQLVVAR